LAARAGADVAPADAAGRRRESVRLGREEVVRELLSDAFELDIEERITTSNVATGEDYWQLFSSSYGPTKTAAEAPDEDRREQFHQTWVDFFDSRYRSGGGVAHP
jgi:hypothetical protein